MKSQEAVLLHNVGLSVEGKKIAKVLDFFGVSWRVLTAVELVRDAPGNKGSVKRRLICSSGDCLLLVDDMERNPGCMRVWEEQVDSAFVYAGGDAAGLLALVQRLTSDKGAALGKIEAGDICVSDQLNDFCGVMSGLRVAASKAGADTSLLLNTTKGNAINIISLGDGAVFLKLEYKGVPVFLSTSGEIIDIDAELTSQNFDVREHFLSAVPLVLYIKWAFAETCWAAPELNACLVIDDPLLKATHGFVDFRELLSLMKRHNFSTNIAFIPANWRRSSPEVVRLFRDNPQNYSISVHGCDHIRAEFAGSHRGRLYWKARRALERMDHHRSLTGICHDRVMVFPHGIFSEAAMSALKHSDFIAAVSNDVTSFDSQPRAITISDVWDVAVMGYAFPLFTRRYPWEGIENFAFDALLGKPAIAVIHHDYCSDHCARLVNFVQQLNALPSAPSWRPLGDVVQRSCRQREVSPGNVEVEMYGTELLIENRSERPKHFLVRRRECEPSAIKRIRAGAQEIAWNSRDGDIAFEVDLNAGENKMIGIKFHGLDGNGPGEETLPYRTKATLRRYLCELRDNYVATSRRRLATLLGPRDQTSEVRGL